ncbi:helix-turn-helix transcriptional regulator [Methylibium rhizosphaerae]|uniref:helix-turn-helix transcriptional regulator n=1 Tax=Methylibium rhizosphaerae TaxID=2570323 RepID=UPI00112B1CE3|nr:helix-turn-helix transcriptional regulator [Methylibium rhizosphaerae]
MNKSTRNRLAAYCHQLSSLDLDGATTVPMAINALGELIGADWAGFIWADCHGEPSALDCDNPAVYRTWPRFDELRRSGEVRRVCGGDFPDWVRCRSRAPNSAEINKKVWHSSAFWNEVVRPTGTGQFCTTAVRDQDRGLGCSVLGRSTLSRPFTPAEQQLVLEFNGHLVHALRRPARHAAEDYVDSGLSAALLVDVSAKVLHRSPQAARLLQMADDGLCPASSSAISALLARGLVSHLLTLRQGGPGRPPVRRITSRWGRQVWRAYSLNEDDRLFLLHIQHEVPKQAAFARGSYALGLSPRQQNVAARLASGLAHRRIAQDLHVKVSTVIDHTRKLYARLDVHDATQLADRLVAATMSTDQRGHSPASFFVNR